MSKLMKRGAVLTASRLSNFAIMMISPLVLVRLLDVTTYGRYQEFILYAMFIMALSELGIDSSLTYFVPRSPERHRSFISQTSVVVLTLSSLLVIAVLSSRSVLVRYISYDFVPQLAAYAFCFVNLNWLEYYWIATRRTDLVLYYSAARLLLRMGVLLLAAYLTRDVEAMLWAIVGAEALRLVSAAAYLQHNRLFTSDWTLADIKTQLRFSGPIGISSLVQWGGRNVGKILISSMLGPAALAHYAVASYLIPVVRLIRGSVADVVFPELVRARTNDVAAVGLWQRTNVLYCLLLFPAFVLLTSNGELIITTLFTEDYLPALPVFQIYMIFLLRRCFNMDVLLRSSGKTSFILFGSILALGVNVALLIVLVQPLGFVGPAIAFVASEVILELYYATQVRRDLRLASTRLVDWKSLGSIALGCLAGLPVLVAARMAPGPPLPWAVAASVSFIAICWSVSYWLGVTDVGKLVRFALSPLRRLIRV